MTREEKRKEEEAMTDHMLAFPQPHFEANAGNFVCPSDFALGGMELRDYFASAVLSGVISEAERMFGEGGIPSTVNRYRYAARVAYQYADAMMEARKR